MRRLALRKANQIKPQNTPLSNRLCESHKLRATIRRARYSEKELWKSNGVLKKSQTLCGWFQLENFKLNLCQEAALRGR